MADEVTLAVDVKRVTGRVVDSTWALVKQVYAQMEERRTRPRDQWAEGGFNPTITERRNVDANILTMQQDIDRLAKERDEAVRVLHLAIHALGLARSAILNAPCAELKPFKTSLVSTINEVVARAGYVWTHTTLGILPVKQR